VQHLFECVKLLKPPLRNVGVEALAGGVEALAGGIEALAGGVEALAGSGSPTFNSVPTPTG
jgi:hypothetical protein